MAIFTHFLYALFSVFHGDNYITKCSASKGNLGIELFINKLSEAVMKYFYYNTSYFQDKKFVKHGFGTVLVSEIELPNSSTLGDAFFRKPVSSDIPIGSIVNIVFGNGRVLKDCKIISWDINGAPDEMLRDVEEISQPAVTLEYQGKKIWAYQAYLCLERDFV